MVTQDRIPLFGQIVEGVVQRSQFGQIVYEEWLRTPEIRQEVTLDEFIAMPDHFHAIVTMDDERKWTPVGGACWRPCPDMKSQEDGERIKSIQPVNRSLARMISQFKATTTRLINDLRGTEGQKVWQRGYDDRIVRNATQLEGYRAYIRNNPTGA